MTRFRESIRRRHLVMTSNKTWCGTIINKTSLAPHIAAYSEVNCCNCIRNKRAAIQREAGVR